MSKVAPNGRLWGDGIIRIVIGYYIHCQNAGIVLFLFKKISPTFKSRLKIKMMSDYYFNVIYPSKGDHFTHLDSHKHLERTQS